MREWQQQQVMMMVVMDSSPQGVKFRAWRNEHGSCTSDP
jgi:hypothetical protein